MAKITDLVQQLSALAGELDRAVAREVAESSAVARAKLQEVSAERDQLRAERDEALVVRQEAERELEVAEKRIETLVQKLKDARQAAAEAGEEAQRALRRQLEALQSECDDARTELEQERSVRKRLEKGAAADEKRLGELERAITSGKGGLDADGESDRREIIRLQSELQVARAAADREQQQCEGLAAELAEATERVAALELAMSRAGSAAAAGGADAAVQIGTLEEKLKAVEAELAAEQLLCRRYARECTEAQKQLAAMSSRSAAEESAAALADKPVAAAKAPTDKLLPHELRPAPKPGALFHPAWDLQALPCSSAGEILQAWASVSNVQLSLEGYPSQYCSAYLVVLKHGKQKQLLLLFNLKEIKHVLVCVPASPPKDEAALAKLLGEGQKYLQMSGFDLEKLAASDIPKRLGHYLHG